MPTQTKALGNSFSCEYSFHISVVFFFLPVIFRSFFLLLLAVIFLYEYTKFFIIIIISFALYTFLSVKLMLKNQNLSHSRQTDELNRKIVCTYACEFMNWCNKALFLHWISSIQFVSVMSHSQVLICGNLFLDFILRKRVQKKTHIQHSALNDPTKQTLSFVNLVDILWLFHFTILSSMFYSWTESKNPNSGVKKRTNKSTHKHIHTSKPKSTM